jgi:hypothetical protein
LIRRGLLGILQIAVLTYGQVVHVGIGAPAKPDQGPKRTVTGTVIDAGSGVPIRHALVQVNGLVPASVLTGADGRFQVENVPEGHVFLFAQKPGYFDSRALSGGDTGPGDSLVTVSTGENDFRLTLYPAARIVGRVTDADGEPVENIQVQVLGEQIVQGRKQWQPRNGASTDDDGAYRIDGLVPGRYKVFINGHLLPASSWNAPPEVTAPAYYPDARDLASGQLLEVGVGREFRADFRLHAERGFRVAGSFSGYPDKAGAGISFENSSGQYVMFPGFGFDPGKGLFSVQGVPAGIWTLVLTSNDGQGSGFEARQEVVVSDADVTDLQVNLHPLASIPVKVNGPPGFAETVVQASLVSVEPFGYRMYGKQEQGTPPVASFVGVAPGKYRLDVQVAGNGCLESATYGSIDLTRDYLVVGQGQEDPETLTINLRNDCATLNLELQPGEKPRSGFMLVIPSSPMAEPKMFQTTGALASLTLSPGSYQVFALSSIEGLEYANPEALREYPRQTINLDPRQKAELTVEVSERKGH